MNQRVLDILEFQKIKDKLASFAASEPGKARAREITPSYHEAKVERGLAETQEAVQVLTKRSRPALVGIRDQEKDFKRLALGGTLTIEQIVYLGDSLRGVQYLKDYFSEEAPPALMGALVDKLTPLRGLRERIERTFESDQEVSDQASPALAQIRQSMVQKKEEVRRKLNSFVTGDSQKYLQDNLVTIRAGRYVIPVKQENKSSIKGLIHDTSSSGATVFIEPLAVVELNNQLRELENKERQEIHRILQELSDQLAENLPALKQNNYAMVELDFIFAKGRLALEEKAIKPRISQEKKLKIDQGRHPLLDPRKVVPIDLDLGYEFKSLIITGPNTGGKTVSLKTTGLLILMAQAGLFVPAGPNTVIPLVHEIYADIGDEQSIEQNLSTFSSHMVNIVDILFKITDQDLVLFDELGAGTDPTEGAALAMTIIDKMRERGILTMATTHYNQLKVYALETPGVANAGMEFDLETLSPTYRLRIGTPGKSNAFEISRRLGLGEDYIQAAKSFIHSDSLKFEDVLEGLERERQDLSRKNQAEEAKQREIEALKARLQREVEKSERQRDRILDQANEKAEKILREAKEQADLALLELKDIQASVASQEEKRLQQTRNYLGENLRSLSKKNKKGLVIEKVARPIEDVKVGDTVFSKSLQQKGQVLELPDKQGNVLVQLGILKMSLPVNSLTYAESQEEARGRVQTKSMISKKSKNFKTELDLRGQTFEEAKSQLEKYIDDAYLSGMSSVRIIHGKGTGALREKVRNFLQHYQPVKKIEDAKMNEGGYGVTIAYLN